MVLILHYSSLGKGCLGSIQVGFPKQLKQMNSGRHGTWRFCKERSQSCLCDEWNQSPGRLGGNSCKCWQVFLGNGQCSFSAESLRVTSLGFEDQETKLKTIKKQVYSKKRNQFSQVFVLLLLLMQLIQILVIWMCCEGGQTTFHSRFRVHDPCLQNQLQILVS